MFVCLFVCFVFFVISSFLFVWYIFFCCWLLFSELFFLLSVVSDGHKARQWETQRCVYPSLSLSLSPSPWSTLLCPHTPLPPRRDSRLHDTAANQACLQQGLAKVFPFVFCILYYFFPFWTNHLLLLFLHLLLLLLRCPADVLTSPAYCFFLAASTLATFRVLKT